jgi:micrococcal nuclease
MYQNRFLTVPERPATDTLKVPVLQIYDGDGFQTKISPIQGVDIEATVRFGFIDAPEIAQPGGREARDFLRSLIGGKTVDIVILTKMDTGKSVDKYRRIVCVPYLSEEQLSAATNGLWSRIFRAGQIVTRNIELEMVVNGWAWVLERYGPDERYYDALADARRARRGIWAYDSNLNPWKFKKRKYKAQAIEPRFFARTESPKLAVEKTICGKQGCDGWLILRNGKHGSFLGCSNFPRCKHTRNQ